MGAEAIIHLMYISIVTIYYILSNIPQALKHEPETWE